MGKKGKKGSGKGKKGKKGKGKKSKEPQMTWEEALLAYKINIKEKQMEDVKYELRALQEKNERHKERNERLQAEQLEYIKILMKQAKQMEDKSMEEKPVKKQEVVSIMMDKWEAARQEEKNIADLKEQIARKAADIAMEEKQEEYWSEYKAKGRHDHSKQIKLLEQELVDMQSTFDEMSSHLNRTLTQAKEEIEENTEETLDKQKYLATEKAMAKMDKYSRQEVLDNDWLRKEVSIHKAEVAELVKVVEGLEHENLQVMSELFDCQVEDLKISRNFYLTQIQEGESLEDNGILEMDLSLLSKGQESKRPRSAIQRAVEDKVFSLAIPSKLERLTREEIDEESEFDGEKCEAVSEQEDPFDNYFHLDEEEASMEDYLRLGPLELKLLSITGQQMSIHKPLPLADDEIKAKDFKPDEWPVTHPMLQKTVDTGNISPKKK